MGQIAGLVIVAEHEFPVLGQFLRLGILVHAVDRGNEPVLQFKRDRFVRREHEFLDQLMRLIVFDPLQPDRLVPPRRGALSLPGNRDRESLARIVFSAAGKPVPRPTCSRSLNWSLGWACKNRVRLRVSQAAARCG